MQMATWSPGRSPASGQHPAQPVGRRVELGEGLHVAGRRHDQGGLVGGRGDECTGEHGSDGSRRYRRGVDSALIKDRFRAVLEARRRKTHRSTSCATSSASSAGTRSTSPTQQRGARLRRASSCAPTFEGVVSGAVRVATVRCAATPTTTTTSATRCSPRSSARGLGIPITLSVLAIEHAQASRRARCSASDCPATSSSAAGPTPICSPTRSTAAAARPRRRARAVRRGHRASGPLARRLPAPGDVDATSSSASSTTSRSHAAATCATAPTSRGSSSC